ncbi:MAG: hypothetical protein ABIF77_07430 [bacterium]
MTKIDLVPAVWHTGRAARRKLRQWGTYLGLVCLVGAILYVGLLHLVTTGKTDLQRLSGKYSTLQGSLQHAESLLMERERLQCQNAAIGLIRSDHPAVWFLANLGDALSPDSYLTSLELMLCGYDDPEQGADGKCRPGLKLLGRAPGHQQVGLTIRQLQTAEQFGEVILVSIDEPARTGKNREVEFKLVCTLRSAAETN